MPLKRYLTGENLRSNTFRLKTMNVYDFDGTIYRGDSTRDFVFYLIACYPKVIIYMPAFLFAAIQYKIGIISKTEMKETLYRFLNSFKDDEIERIVANFWKTRINNIFDWYYKKKDSSDVVVSASPRFILEPICDELNVDLICSEVNVLNGNYIGENCWGEEKVRRFYEKYPDATINEFYSDSKSDTPLAKLAKKAYLVNKRGELTDWL